MYWLGNVLPRILDYPCICFLMRAFALPVGRSEPYPQHVAKASLASPGSSPASSLGFSVSWGFGGDHFLELHAPLGPRAVLLGECLLGERCGWWHMIKGCGHMCSGQKLKIRYSPFGFYCQGFWEIHNFSQNFVSHKRSGGLKRNSCDFGLYILSSRLAVLPLFRLRLVD